MIEEDVHEERVASVIRSGRGKVLFRGRQHFEDLLLGNAREPLDKFADGVAGFEVFQKGFGGYSGAFEGPCAVSLFGERSRAGQWDQSSMVGGIYILV